LITARHAVERSGAAPKGGGVKGDLYVEIRVRADKRFERRDATLSVT